MENFLTTESCSVGEAVVCHVMALRWQLFGGDSVRNNMQQGVRFL